jgi:8-hydroxy-5-deazaflavin:NADPH oxidoreductase
MQSGEAAGREDPLAFVGGTGPEGRGLALRFAAAGEAVLIGSRERARAERVAADIAAAVPGARVGGVDNRDAIAASDRIVLALPATALPGFLDGAAAALAGKLIIDVMVPLTIEHGIATLVPPRGAASIGELVQARVPTARVVSAFKNLSADVLADPAARLAGDVVLCGDDARARATVAALVARLRGLRAVDAGPLVNARYVEALTALLLNLNYRHHARTSVAILGL